MFSITITVIEAKTLDIKKLDKIKKNHHNARSAEALFNSLMLDMNTATTRSKYICLFTGRSLIEESCACNFASSSSFPQKKQLKIKMIAALYIMVYYI